MTIPQHIDEIGIMIWGKYWNDQSEGPHRRFEILDEVWAHARRHVSSEISRRVVSILPQEVCKFILKQPYGVEGIIGPFPLPPRRNDTNETD